MNVSIVNVSIVNVSTPFCLDCAWRWHNEGKCMFG